MKSEYNAQQESVKNSAQEEKEPLKGGIPRQEENGSLEIDEREMKNTVGGSSLMPGSNDFGNSLGGSITVSNSTNGSAGDRSYSNDDSHTVNYGFGQQSEQSGY